MASKLKINREKGLILVKRVRLSYPHLFEKWGKEGEPESKKRYSAKFLLDKKTHAEEIKEIRRYIAELMQTWFKAKIGSANLFFRDGDDSGKEEQEGCYVISASESRRRPQVINKDKSPIVESDDIIYPGCYVNVLIRPWKQDNQYGKKINANLVTVQFAADGERFGEGPIDGSEEFDDESDEDFADDDTDDFDD